jgi:CubicO group peptidase (beta-lactamase class C family)
MAVREPLIASCVAGKIVGDPSTLVPWWSIAKTAIAACALVLVAGGRLDLDRTMPGRRFTLRQLLQHTSGLPCYTESDEYEVAGRAAPTTRGAKRTCSRTSMPRSFCSSRGMAGPIRTADIFWCAG